MTSLRYLNPFFWMGQAWRVVDRVASAAIDAVNPYDLSKIKQRNLDPVAIEESPVRKSASKIFIFSFLLFVAWAYWAPIDQGVFVPGSVTVEGNRKQVQHPSGGVITAILVKEGDTVTQGQVLLRVNPLNSEANLTTAELQYINLLATESRLLSELTGAGSIQWKPELSRYSRDARAREAMAIQQKLFTTRRAEFNNALAAQRVQVDTLTVEARNAQQLAKEGLMAQAQADGILRNKVQSEAAISQLINGRQTTINNELAEAQKNREGLQQRVQSLAFDADLNNVKAPVAGVISGLKVNTIGGVVTGSQVLMEVVPQQETLVVEARVPVADINKVRVGMETDLRFSTFNQRTTPVVQGRVTLVGADKIASDKAVDIQAANPQGDYYIARVELSPDAAEKLLPNVVQPGLPVEVIVKSGERNFISYVMKPLTDSFAKSFLN